MALTTDPSRTAEEVRRLNGIFDGLTTYQTVTVQHVAPVLYRIYQKTAHLARLMGMPYPAFTAPRSAATEAAIIAQIQAVLTAYAAANSPTAPALILRLRQMVATLNSQTGVV